MFIGLYICILLWQNVLEFSLLFLMLCVGVCVFKLSTQLRFLVYSCRVQTAVENMSQLIAHVLASCNNFFNFDVSFLCYTHWKHSAAGLRMRIEFWFHWRKWFFKLLMLWHRANVSFHFVCHFFATHTDTEDSTTTTATKPIPTSANDVSSSPTPCANKEPGKHVISVCYDTAALSLCVAHTEVEV